MFGFLCQLVPCHYVAVETFCPAAQFRPTNPWRVPESQHWSLCNAVSILQCTSVHVKQRSRGRTPGIHFSREKVTLSAFRFTWHGSSLYLYLCVEIISCLQVRLIWVGGSKNQHISELEFFMSNQFPFIFLVDGVFNLFRSSITTLLSECRLLGAHGRVTFPHSTRQVAWHSSRGKHVGPMWSVFSFNSVLRRSPGPDIPFLRRESTSPLFGLGHRRSLRLAAWCFPVVSSPVRDRPRPESWLPESCDSWVVTIGNNCQVTVRARSAHVVTMLSRPWKTTETGQTRFRNIRMK